MWQRLVGFAQGLYQYFPLRTEAKNVPVSAYGLLTSRTLKRNNVGNVIGICQFGMSLRTSQFVLVDGDRWCKSLIHGALVLCVGICKLFQCRMVLDWELNRFSFDFPPDLLTVPYLALPFPEPTQKGPTALSSRNLNFSSGPQTQDFPHRTQHKPTYKDKPGSLW